MNINYFQLTHHFESKEPDQPCYPLLSANTIYSVPNVPSGWSIAWPIGKDVHQKSWFFYGFGRSFERLQTDPAIAWSTKRTWEFLYISWNNSFAAKRTKSLRSEWCFKQCATILVSESSKETVQRVELFLLFIRSLWKTSENLLFATLSRTENRSNSSRDQYRNLKMS